MSSSELRDDDNVVPREEEIRKRVEEAKRLAKGELYAEALAEYDICLTMVPADDSIKLGQLLYRRARVYVKEGRLGEAESDLDAAIVCCPEVSNIYELKGMVQMRLSRYAEASSTLLACLRLSPTDLRARKHFDECLRALREQSLAYGCRRRRPSVPMRSSGIAAITENLLRMSSVSTLEFVSDDKMNEALEKARARIHLDSIVDAEINFWQSHGLKLSFKEVSDELRQVIKNYRPQLASVFIHSCLMGPPSSVNDEAQLPSSFSPFDEIRKFWDESESCSARHLLDTLCMSGSHLLALLQDGIDLFEEDGLSQECGVIALGQTMGLANSKSFRRANEQEIPFENEVSVDSPSESARGMLQSRPCCEWADEIAPKRRDRAIYFQQFVEIVARLSLAQLDADTPEPLLSTEDDEEQNFMPFEKSRTHSVHSTTSSRYRRESSIRTLSRMDEEESYVSSTSRGGNSETSREGEENEEDDDDSYSETASSKASSYQFSIRSGPQRPPSCSRSRRMRPASLRRTSSKMSTDNFHIPHKDNDNFRRRRLSSASVHSVQSNALGEGLGMSGDAETITLKEVRSKIQISIVSDRFASVCDQLIQHYSLGEGSLMDLGNGEDWLESYHTLFDTYRRHNTHHATKDIDLREFAQIVHQLGLTGPPPRLSLADIVRIAATACSFAGDSTHDRIDQSHFMNALILCVEIRTFDGLLPPRQRVSSFLSSIFPI